MASRSEKNWRETLNLPRTDFPMKANLRQREPEFIRSWQETRLYERIREARKGAPLFILHDGPPYANGPIHLGTALNKILKDITVKSRFLMGYDAPFVPGWDCHGLPIEQNVEKELGTRLKTMDPLEFRRYCRSYAERFIDIQRKGFIRLGVLGSWDTPYRTMDPDYQATIVRVLGAFIKAGLVYRGLRSVHWCFTDKTALAEAEIEYRNRTSPSIYVKMPLPDDEARRLYPDINFQGPVFAIIWTTTPWTLPANVAIAFHPEYEYGLYRVQGEYWIVAKALWNTFAEITGVTGELIATKKGHDFEYARFRHPFYDRDSIGILGEYVTLEQGTGCVHTAPGHGLEDFLVGKAYNLDILSPVNEDGTFTEEAHPFTGLHVFDANQRIIDYLKDKGMLIWVGTLEHSYPHCWRCKNPLIFRATEQWFVSMEKSGFRQEALEAIREVQWVPAWGEDRIYQMIENRPDWCISRQRLWGVPIPAFTCKDCGHHFTHENIFEHVARIFEREGADAWYARSARELAPEGTVCPQCGSEYFEKGMDILDVWFDSGSSHEAVLGNSRFGLQWPADVYLEGNDQYRGWFNSSLLVGMVTRKQSPYRICVTHGMVVDENGLKMSKSLGNYIDPIEVCEQLGAEILRAWVAMVDFQEDMRMSHTILEMVATHYRKIRNTIRFMLGNLYDYQPDCHRVPVEAMNPVDRYMLKRLSELEQKVLRGYQTFAYHTVYHALNQFATVELSAFYLDITKDRLYCSAPDSIERRAGQTVIFEIARSFLKLCAPIYSFTAHEAWQYLPEWGGKPESVFMDAFEAPHRFPLDDDEYHRFQTFMEIREEALKALEEARVQKIIGSSLDAHLELTVHHRLAWVREHHSTLKEILMVSDINIQTGDVSGEHPYTIRVEHARGNKCARCWLWSPAVGSFPDQPDLCERCYHVLNPAHQESLR